MKLVCPVCNSTDPEAVVDGPTEWKCIRCEGNLSTEIARYDDWSQAVVDAPGVARYTHLLPAASTDDLASVDAALQPLDSPELARALGVAAVRLMPQTLNDTGTFKDNEAVLLAAKCKEWGLASVSMHSSGNTARAYQHYMDRAGVQCTGFVPKASAYKCTHPQIGASPIHAVDGNMLAAAEAAIAHAESTGAIRLTPSEWKVEGKVPLGLAIAERCPDTTVIAVTIASGYGPLGMERGLQRVRDAGLPGPADPHFRLFQSTDANVLGQAILAGDEEIDLTTMVPPEQAFEPTLQSTNPNRTLPLVRSFLARTGSRIDPVSPSEVEARAGAFTVACSDLGIPIDYTTEKSAYICWAGLVAAAQGGELSPSDRITMIVSGSAPPGLI